MYHTELVTSQISTITSRARTRAINELADGFGADDHQALDATRFTPPANFGRNIITMRREMAIPARGGDYANA